MSTLTTGGAMGDEKMKPLLDVRSLNAFYGQSHVLHGIDFKVYSGEVVTLIGRNGAGKTTALRSIMGIVPKISGTVCFNGHDLQSLQAHKIPRLGLGYVPEERAIFASLNVRENLLLPPKVADGGMSVEDIYDLFPNLRGRDTAQGTQLSGGEQQMLAIGRVLRTGASMLLLDEPTEGLAPVIIDQIATAIQKLKERGFTILLVEQNLRFAASVADRYYVLQEGEMVDVIHRNEFDEKRDTLSRYLGV